MKKLIKNNIKPVKEYKNAELQKREILKENKNKIGIYCWINLKNDKIYIGSSINIYTRLLKYYSKNNLISNPSKIHLALRKNGFKNFALAIIEYCDLTNLRKKEQYYINKLETDYNIKKIVGSNYGCKASAKTRKN